MAGTEPGYDVQLARDHSLLLEERLRGSGTHGPSSFAGLLGNHTNRVNEYAFLAPDEDAEPGQKPLQRWVSNIGRVVPSGVQLEPRKLDIQMPPHAAAAARGAHAAQPHAGAAAYAHAEQAAKKLRLSGQFSGAGQGGQVPAQQQQQQRKAPVPPPVHAQAAMVPGNPLKIRLKITNNRPVSREGSAEKRTPPLAGVTASAAAQLLQSVRQLGAGSDPLLSPIPQAWADVVSNSPAGQAAGHEAAQRGAAEQQAASSMPSPFESVSAGASGEQHGAAAAAGAAAQQWQAQQQQAEPLPAQQQRQPSPPAQQQQWQPSPPVQQHRQPSPPVQPQQHRQPSPPAAAAVGSKRAAATSAAHSPTAAAPGVKSPAAEPPVKRQRGPGTVGGSGSVSPQYPTPSVQPDGSAALSAATGADMPPHASSGSHGLGQAHSTNLGPAPAAGAAPQRKQAAALAAPKQDRQRSATPPAGLQQVAAAQQRQQPAVPAWVAEALEGRSDSSRLGVVAALLPSVLDPAASDELPPCRAVQSLQEEGKKLKKFAEKKTKDGKPTHVSSMFLCQSCVKFLTVAATMEAHPAKFSRESTSSMYSQTASLLDSCAHNAGRAEGPAMITTAISLLAQRLAAVARLRAAYCLRSEGMQQVAAFRGALEKASGETYQRPSPTDSNTSTSISVPLDTSVGPVKAQPTGGGRDGSPPGGRARTQPASAAAGGSKAAAPVVTLPEPALVGMPKAVLERQLMAAQHSQALLAALSSFSKSSEKLREFMGQAAAQSNVQGLKVAASALLLSADAGMGPAGGILSFAKDALDAVMQMQ